MDNNLHYCVGICDKKYVQKNGNVYVQSEIFTKGNRRVIECNIEEKTMIIKTQNSIDEEWVKMDESGLKKDVIIDLNENGVRWQGDSLNGIPFGYGCIYNENNILCFQGFTFERRIVCYGIDYYPDTGNIEYIGQFYKNHRYGKGILYDKKGNEVYNGEWFFDKPIELQTYNIENKLNVNSISHSVMELIVKDGCHYKYENLRLYGLMYLKRIVFGKNCLNQVKCFVIDFCNDLKEIVICDRSFSETTSLTLSSIF